LIHIILSKAFNIVFGLAIVALIKVGCSDARRCSFITETEAEIEAEEEELTESIG
jgi:hypothetical protein